ncbi:DUF2510 domain-containing protein [Streptomyces sp. M10(2022)]
MSNATPPGWYPDVGTPGTERWWDGTAWTAHTRPLAAAQPGPYQQRFGAPQYPSPLPRRAGSGGRRAVAIALSALVVVGAAVTGVVVLNQDEGGTPPRSAPSSAAPVPGATDAGTTPSPSDSATGDPRVLVDQLNGITLPVPDGWEKPESTWTTCRPCARWTPTAAPATRGASVITARSPPVRRAARTSLPPRRSPRPTSRPPPTTRTRRTASGT